MSKRKKKKTKLKRKTGLSNSRIKINPKFRGRISDVSGRGFPPAAERNRLIKFIRSTSDEDRLPEMWYNLGSLLIYNACLEDDDRLLNEGTRALMEAANSDPPIGDAALELTWLLNLRGLPAMALQYACQATELMAKYLEAPEYAPSFVLPITNGIKLAIRLANMKALDVFVKIIEERFNSHSAC